MNAERHWQVAEVMAMAGKHPVISSLGKDLDPATADGNLESELPGKD